MPETLKDFLHVVNRQPFLHNSPLVLSSDLTAAALEIAAASSSPLSDGNGRNNSSPVIQDLTLAFRGWKKCSLISLPMFLDFPKRLPFQFIGPRGGAKSATAKATGGTAGIPTIAFDLAAMESSLVGASTERLHTYDVSGDLPDDEGWTGAEIKECYRKAHRVRMTLAEASRLIVPVSRSAGEQIKALRQMASGKFISASTPGVYRYEEEIVAQGRRVIRRNEPVTLLAPPRSEA